MTISKITDTFIDLCRINSPSGKEREVLLYISKILRSLKWKVWTDDVGSIVNSNTGNLYAYLEVDPSQDTIVFSAHCDTVSSVEDKIKVKYTKGIFKSVGTTILGADNRAGITCLLNLADVINRSKLKNNLLLFFPVREESGEMGSKYFEFGKTPIKYMFNVDGGDRPGTFVYRSLGFCDFSIEVQGKSAHAAKDYHKGKNAILAAADLVQKLPIGANKKEGTTLNIGKILGGQSTNIVPDHVQIKGEVRAFENYKIDELLNKVKKTCKDIEKKQGITAKVDVLTKVPPFSNSMNANVVKQCRTVCNSIRLKSAFNVAYYTSDANNLFKHCKNTIVVSRGGKNAHTKRESIGLKELKTSCKLVEQLAYIS